MKYMILTFGDQATMMQERTVTWVREMIQFMKGLVGELKASGELIDARGLADPTQAKTVRFQSGLPVPTDGPFAEAKEALAGFWLVDVESEARALEIAAHIVKFIERPIEVRQIMDAPPDL